jgi:hypothetical protein
VPKLSVRVQEILSRAHGNFEEQNKVLWPFVIIIIKYYSIIIITHITILWYNYSIVQLLYYISNKGLLEECDKEENVAVTVAATASV